MRDAIGLIASANVSTLASVVSKEILQSPKLHVVLQLSSHRLGEAYDRVTRFFQIAKIQFMPSDATTCVMAKLAPASQTQADDIEAMNRYRQAGVALSPAFAYHMPSSYRGWFRVSFAVDEKSLMTAVERMKIVYGVLLEGTVG